MRWPFLGHLSNASLQASFCCFLEFMCKTKLLVKSKVPLGCLFLNLSKSLGVFFTAFFFLFGEGRIFYYAHT